MPRSRLPTASSCDGEYEENQISHVYVRSNECGWIPALQLKATRDVAKVVLSKFKTEAEILQCNKSTMRMTDTVAVDPREYPNGILPMQNVDSSGNLEEFKDMVNLPFLHEAAILYNLKLRHVREKPYTRTGDIVIAVNPYQWIPGMYSGRKQQLYSDRLVWENNCGGGGGGSKSGGGDPRDTVEPHVYEVSALSYKGLALEGENQSILVSGESGAGKTETVKICLDHIAAVQRGPAAASATAAAGAETDPVVRRVVESNPLLEAFGNAKTRRNDNSSRFGKYLQLQFRKGPASVDAGSSLYPAVPAHSALVGSDCQVYLLEKNRVVHHEAQERTFHIFYQLLASSDAVKRRYWSKLAGATKESFKYVGPTDTVAIEGVGDADRFQRTVEALELVNVSGDRLDGLMRAVCICMQLGNLEFDAKGGDVDRSVCSTAAELRDLASLMGISETDLQTALTERTFTTRGETHKVPLSAAAAKEAADALAKEAYQKAFLWLVQAINDATRAENNDSDDSDDSPASFGTIGLLDIFGFEAFQTNRFEQLCINYANEKLQQKFTEDVFRNVQEEYEAEGIPLGEIYYDDNTDVLDLIEGGSSSLGRGGGGVSSAAPGLLALLNEECVRPKGNDREFVYKALRANENSACLIQHRTDRLSFGIYHYAGGVMYDAEGMVQRNLDTLPTDLQAAAERCTNFIINRPRSETSARVGSGGNSKNRGGAAGAFDRRVQRSASPSGRFRESNIAAPTVWTKYRNQLSDLMKNLRLTRSRYIRCIKPNTKKQPIVMEHVPVVEQLRCAGVVAGITISRSVFPNRLDNHVVLARYYNMWDVARYPSQKTADMSDRQRRAEDCRAAMKSALGGRRVRDEKTGKTVEAFCVGRTRTYFRAGALESLESNRREGLDAQAATIQRYARGWLVRWQQTEGARRRKERAAAAAAEAQRERERAAAERERVRADREKQCRALQEQLERLEREVQQVDRDGRRKVDEARARAERVREECEELQEKKLADQKHKVLQDKMMLASQEKKIDEARKLIEYLKRENKKVRKNYSKVKSRWSELMESSQNMTKYNEEMGREFDEQNEETKRYSTKFDSLQRSRDTSRVQNRELKNKVQKMQDQYMEQAEGRLELQKSMAAILVMIQDRCRQQQVVEDAVVVALECETMAKAEMAALEVATRELDEDYDSGYHQPPPALVQSDVSETEVSDHFG